jgi:EAL domain-containing protein (putative c-di-GMP-specific phosphodiesterase class I)
LRFCTSFAPSVSGSRWTISEPLNSSLSYLRRAVTGLGKSLGIVTTAEGVKIDAQFELLRREGCTQAHCYLFSPSPR